jgi:CAAX protease family protein
MEKMTMVTNIQQVQVKHSARWGSSVVEFLRLHPLWGFFLLAFGFTWGWEIPLFGLSHQQLLGPWVLLGPTLAGFVMAGITEGRAGIVRLLRRVLIWRVSIRWYLVVLFLLPVVWLVSVALMPGAAAAFQVPSASFLFTYLAAFAFSFLSSFWVEEFGWRGFALPRLQRMQGPLLGTLILGSFHALWHLPAWAFFPSATGAGTSFLSFTFAITLFGFGCETVALAILYTWVFNHTRGSILLMILFHATGIAAAGSFLTLFPSLFPQPVIPVVYEISVIVAAVLVVLATRGRLGYDDYRRDAAVPSQGAGLKQKSDLATTL